MMLTCDANAVVGYDVDVEVEDQCFMMQQSMSIGNITTIVGTEIYLSLKTYLTINARGEASDQ